RVGQRRRGGLDVSLQLDDTRSVRLALEVSGKKSPGFGPQRGELAANDRAHGGAAAELRSEADHETHERRKRRVRATLGVERLLEAGVGTAEGSVVPVETTARIRDGGDERQQDGREEAGPQLRLCAGVRLGENTCCGLADQLVERNHGVLQRREAASARLHIAADERSVLVE